MESTSETINSIKRYFIENLYDFDERFYVTINKDLIKKVRNKKHAIQHVLNYGITENRVIFSQDEHNKNLFLIIYPQKSDVINFLYKNKHNFDVDYYIDKYPDLKSLGLKEKLWNHYIHSGMNETRELFKDETLNFKIFCFLHDIDNLLDYDSNDSVSDYENESDDEDNIQPYNTYENNEYENNLYENNEHENNLYENNEHENNLYESKNDTETENIVESENMIEYVNDTETENTVKTVNETVCDC